MTNTELTASSAVYLGSTQAQAVYIGNTLVWQYNSSSQVVDATCVTNPDVESAYHIYVNKNFHFNSTHQYKIEAKVKWLNNHTNPDGQQTVIIGLGKYKAAINVDGYWIYWHNSNKIYSNGLGVSYSNKGSSANEITISDTITGLTNEYYLTLYSNIRAYARTMTNVEIYYVKITDLTTNTVVCNLLPKYNQTTGDYFFYDTTNDTNYYFQTLSPNMRNQSGLTTYANE